MPERNEPAIVSSRLGESVEFLDEPLSDEEADSREMMTRGKDDRVEEKCVHPLIKAVHVAFAQHRPLILSPDISGLVISQGFGHHIHENAEALRSRLVRHEGRKTLQAAAYDL